MKKIKFMLMSLSLLAVIGGALAFKAKFDQDFCSALAIPGGPLGSTCVAAAGNISCPNLADNSTTDADDEDPGIYYCTTNFFGGGNTCTSRNSQQQIITTTCATPVQLTVTGD